MRGDDLKKRTNVDTFYDCEHNLALSYRDNGDYSKALSMFLKNYTIDQIFNESDSGDFNAALFGNVGRCLQLQGKGDEALRCFRRSISMLEADETSNRLSNQAYARQWIGEVLKTQGHHSIALAFFEEAEQIASRIAPARARKINNLIRQLEAEHPKALLAQGEAKRLVDRWIRGIK